MAERIKIERVAIAVLSFTEKELEYLRDITQNSNRYFPPDTEPEEETKLRRDLFTLFNDVFKEV